MKAHRHLLALALVLPLLNLRAADCSTQLRIDSYTEIYSSFDDILQTSLPDLPGPLGVLLPWNEPKIPVTISGAVILGGILENQCGAIKFFSGGVGFSAGHGANPDISSGAASIKFDLAVSDGAAHAVKSIFDSEVNGVKDIFDPAFEPCGEHQIVRFAHLGGDMSGYVFNFGAGAYPRRISKGKLHFCRDLVVENASGGAIELPLSISGSLHIEGGLAADNDIGKKNYAKAHLKISGSIGGQSVSNGAALFAAGSNLDVFGYDASVNATHSVSISPGVGITTVHIELDCEGYMEIQAHSSALFGLIAGAATAQVEFPNSIDIGWPTGPGGSPLPAGVRIYDAEDGSVYADTTANPVFILPVAAQTPIWDFAPPLDVGLGGLLPNVHAMTNHDDTTLISPPGTGAGLVRRNDAAVDPLASPTNHTAFRLAYTAHSSNTAPAFTVFIYDKPGGSPHALAYEIGSLTPGYHEVTLRYADGDASGRGLFAPGALDLTRVHSIAVANTVITNWPDQAASVTTGSFAVTFHHLAAFTPSAGDYDGFAIINHFRDAFGRFHFRYPANTNSYYVIYRGETVISVTNPVALTLATNTFGEFILTNNTPSAFFRLREIPLAQPLDLDGDGFDDITEFRNPPTFNPFVPNTPIVTNQPPPSGTNAPPPIVPTNAPSNSGQIYQWTLNNHRYMPVLVTNGITWEQARAAAQAVGGHLATITSAAENDFVFALVDQPEYWSAFFVSSQGPWIGGLQAQGAPEPAAGWGWVTQEQFGFTAWNAGEPNNAGDGGTNEDRIHYWGSAPDLRTNRWNDVRASWLVPGYIVEFEPPNTSGDCIPRNGLVAWWRADGNALDSAGTNDGVLVNGASFGSGISGSAFQFDGTDDARKVPITASLMLANDFSVAAWVNPSGFGGVNSLPVTISTIQTGNPDGSVCCLSGWSLYLGNDGQIKFGLSAGELSDPEKTILQGPVVPQGAFAHVAATVADRGDVREVTLYLNGQRVVTTNTAKIFIPTPVGQDLYIGSQHGSSSPFPRWFNGLIDDVVVYNRALSSDEIAGIYSGGITGRCKPQCVPTPSSLVAWWPANGSATDAVGRNNGIMQNGATFAPGPVGEAFSFDGTAMKAVEVSDHPSLNFETNSFSADVWARAEPFDNAKYHVVACKRRWDGAFAFGWWLGIEKNTGRWLIRISRGAEILDARADMPANPDDFAHLAFVIDREANALSLFVNGVRQQSVANLGSFGSLSSTGSLYMGYEFNTPAIATSQHQEFTGTIDELSIYSRALSSAEIAATYFAGSAGKCKPPDCSAPPQGLVAWWPADGNTLDVVGANNGTLQDGATFTNGISGQAFNFDGVEDYIDIGALPQLDAAGARHGFAVKTSLTEKLQSSENGTRTLLSTTRFFSTPASRAFRTDANWFWVSKTALNHTLGRACQFRHNNGFTSLPHGGTPTAKS